jgi:hypothetical protein
MERRTLLVLLLSLPAAIGAWASLREPGIAADDSRWRTDPVKAFDQAAVSRFEIDSRAHGRLVLSKRGAAGDRAAGQMWTFADQSEEEVDADDADALASGVANLYFTEPARADAATLRSLRLDEDNGVHLVASGTGGLLADLVVGVSKDRFTLVRRPGGDQVWQVSGLPLAFLHYDRQQWRNRTALSFDPADMISATLESAGSRMIIASVGVDEATSSSRWHIRVDGRQGEPMLETTSDRRIDRAVAELSHLRADEIAEGVVGSARLVWRVRLPRSSHQVQVWGADARGCFAQVDDRLTKYHLPAERCRELDAPLEIFRRVSGKAVATAGRTSRSR